MRKRRKRRRRSRRRRRRSRKRRRRKEATQCATGESDDGMLNNLDDRRAVNDTYFQKLGVESRPTPHFMVAHYAKLLQNTPN